MNNGNKSGNITISKRLLIIIIVVVVLVCSASIIVGVNWNAWFGDKPPANDGGWTPDIDDNAGNYTPSNPIPDQGGATVGIKIPGYPSITIPKNTQDVKIALINPEGNPCYFVFEIVLKETGESLYKSKMVPPGQAITDVHLSRGFDTGEYPATIIISTYSVTDGASMNGANVETVIKAN